MIKTFFIKTFILGIDSSFTKEAFDKVVFHHASISDAISST
jgi:hypothetical protein